jgi:hypothetical protein
MKRSFFYVIWLIFLQLIFLSSSFAFQMAEYWPIKAGNLSIFDNEILATGSNTQTFGAYNAHKMFFGSTFCGTLCGGHFYFYLGAEGLLGVSVYEDGGSVDFSATPIKLFTAEMQIGESVISTVPAGVLDDDPLSFTATLLAEETIIVPAGTFTDTLVLELFVVDSPTSQYTEKLWLAKGVGPVKIERVSELPTTTHEGCFFTCGSFDLGTENVVQRVIELEDFFSQRKGAVVIPLF